MEFHGSWILALETPVGVTQFCGISMGEAFLSEISKGKSDKSKNSRGLFPKIMSSTSPV